MPDTSPLTPSKLAFLDKVHKDLETTPTLEDITDRLRKRAEIRRQISTRKSVLEGKPDRISDLLEEAAKEISSLRWELDMAKMALTEKW